MSMHRRHFIQELAGAATIGALSRLGAAFAQPMQDQPQTLRAADYRAQRRFAATPFGRIAYLDRGKGRTTLFLHGFPLNSYQWRGVIARVEHRRRSIAPDLLGLGYTEVKAGQSVTPATQVAMVSALLDGLSIKQVDLVANDSGGAVAQLFLARHPERVRTILLTNCDTEPDSPPSAVVPVIELARAGRFADAWLAPWVADKSPARSPKGLGGIAYTFPDKLENETIDYYLGPLVSTPERKALVERLRDRARSQSAGGHRSGAAADQCSRAHRLGRRRILHFNVTKHPTRCWIVQQLREAFPFEAAPRFLIHDRDAKYGTEVPAAIRALKINAVRTSFESPWQNGVAERWVGNCRRELLDHAIALNERHLKRLLSEYVSHHHEDRTHLGLGKETPGCRTRCVTSGRVLSHDRLGGLHHRYDRAT
jgi:haloalkane dehalogenase